jgi:hypothetical protein
MVIMANTESYDTILPFHHYCHYTHSILTSFQKKQQEALFRLDIRVVCYSHYLSYLCFSDRRDNLCM